MKKIFLFLITSIYLCGCNSNEPMRIRFTSVNDFYADYIFNLKNNTNGLKEINQYVLKEIKKQKRVVDSIRKTKYKPRFTSEEMLNKGSFSLKADNIILYTPTYGSEDIVIEYKVGKESFKVEKIEIGEKYKNVKFPIETLTSTNKCTITIAVKSFNLESLFHILNKIESLGYHKKIANFKYLINNNNIDLLEVIYTDKGKYIKLNYL